MTEFERKVLMGIEEIKVLIATSTSDQYSLQKAKNNYEALRSGYVSFYPDDAISEEKPEEWTQVILDVLSMYSYMINSIQNNQKPPYNHYLKDVKFPGFDGNYETEEKAFVRYFLEDLGGFGEIRELNKNDYDSHTEMMPKYKRMLDEFEKMEKPCIMTDDQIDRLLKA